MNPNGYLGSGVLYLWMRRLADAERELKKAIELAPQGVHTRYVLAFVLADRGRDAEALATASEEPTRWGRLTALAYVHHKAGRMTESTEALRELTALHAQDAGFQIAQIHAARGETDAAFEWLERALAERDVGMSWTKFEPTFVILRDDPRWAALLVRLGLA